MKKLFILLALLLQMSHTYSQDRPLGNIEYEKAGENEIFYVLEQMGYRFFKLRLPVDQTRSYNVEAIVEEFENGELKKSEEISLAPTTRKIIYRGQSEITTMSFDELSIILNSNKQVESNNISFYIHDIMSRIFPIEISDRHVAYSSRPFEKQEIIAGQKIPVVLFGAFWYDEEFGVHRFCGSDQVDAAMEDELFRLSPHYYIVSIKFEENHDGVRDFNQL